MTGVDEVLKAMMTDGDIVDIDSHFARLMTRMDPAGGAALAVAAAQVSAASLRGNTGTDRDELAAACGRWLGDGHAAVDVLQASAVCGDGGNVTPIVDDRGRFYLYRYWDYECRLAAALRARNVDAADAPEPGVLRPLLDRLFSSPDSTSVDWQRVAAALALRRLLTIVSGGPGTGKTTTMVKVLAMVVECLGAECRIALAAPTGKAAARMQQAVDEAGRGLEIDASVRDAIPGEASTIHRLLGMRREGGFRHHADNPLAVDVLVVDEVSMVDLALMVRLVEAVPGDARLILLGDRDQLASVEPGSVFADLCLGAGGLDQGTAAWLSEATGQRIEPRAADVLPGACISLTRSYRFGPDSGVGVLSAAVKRGDVGDSDAVLEDENHDDVSWLDEADDRGNASPLDRLLPTYRERIEAAYAEADAARVFEQYRQFQVLCAVRRGARGVDDINRRIERGLAETGLVDSDDPWYVGRPLMITANDYGLNLFNGDLGIVLPWGPKREARVCFLGQDSEPRWLHGARLPAHETAWAMTVHKSQGSEFENVMLVLPARESPILTRELIYTAVSRARRRVIVSGSRDILGAAIARRATRQSGLADRLR